MFLTSVLKNCSQILKCVKRNFIFMFCATKNLFALSAEMSKYGLSEHSLYVRNCTDLNEANYKGQVRIQKFYIPTHLHSAPAYSNNRQF